MPALVESLVPAYIGPLETAYGSQVHFFHIPAGTGVSLHFCEGVPYV